MVTYFEGLEVLNLIVTEFVDCGRQVMPGIEGLFLYLHGSFFL